LSFVIWFCLAFVAIFGIDEIRITFKTENIEAWIGLTCLTVHMILGPVLIFLSPAQAPAGKQKVKAWHLVMRGILASLAIFTSLMLTLVDDTAAGMATGFPAVFSTTMISLWLSQDSSVPLGAVGPLIVGSSAVPMYACLFYGFVVLLKPRMEMVWTIVIATLVSYVGAVISCSLPAYYIIRCGNKEEEVDFVEDETTAMMYKIKD